MCFNGAVFEAIAHDWRTASIAPTHSSVAQRKRDLDDLVLRNAELHTTVFCARRRDRRPTNGRVGATVMTL